MAIQANYIHMISYIQVHLTLHCILLNMLVKWKNNLRPMSYRRVARTANLKYHPKGNETWWKGGWTKCYEGLLKSGSVCLVPKWWSPRPSEKVGLPPVTLKNQANWDMAIFENSKRSENSAGISQLSWQDKTTRNKSGNHQISCWYLCWICQDSEIKVVDSFYLAALNVTTLAGSTCNLERPEFRSMHRLKANALKSAFHSRWISVHLGFRFKK